MTTPRNISSTTAASYCYLLLLWISHPKGAWTPFPPLSNPLDPFQQAQSVHYILEHPVEYALKFNRGGFRLDTMDSKLVKLGPRSDIASEGK